MENKILFFYKFVYFVHTDAFFFLSFIYSFIYLPIRLCVE